MPTKGVIVLAVAALAVVCLGALTITSQRTELLVGSYNARAMHGQAAPHPPRGIGNQAAQNGFNPNFYNAPSHAHGFKARVGQKNLVGSYPVYHKNMPKGGKQVPLSHFIGDQMKNSARKSPVQKLMVGSYRVDTKRGNKAPQQPHGIGNQAAPHYGIAAGFYNHAARKVPVRTNKLLVGSTFLDPKNKQHHSTHGFGNQAAQMGDNPNFYNAPTHKSQVQKLLVGSFNVDQQHKGFHQTGLGNQAAPQNHFDVGTNIVFHGIKSEGGIRGIKKHAQEKGLVGSTFVQRKNNKPLQQPHGFGDQSVSRGTNPNFYNAPSH